MYLKVLSGKLKQTKPILFNIYLGLFVKYEKVRLLIYTYVNFNLKSAKNSNPTISALNVEVLRLLYVIQKLCYCIVTCSFYAISYGSKACEVQSFAMCMASQQNERNVMTM